MQDPMIGEALDLERVFLQNHEERLRYILSYKAMVDDLTIEETIRRGARAEGIAEGEVKGKAEGIAATAQRMLGMNFTSEQRSQAAGLSLNEVEALKAGTGN